MGFSSTAAVTHYVETRWPTIGGKDLAPLPEHTFLDPEFAEAYQPGHVAYVYVAGSGDTLKAPDQPTGLHGLARRFALPLFKISATASENALARIEDINLERYAGMYEAEAGLACDPGYDNWRLVLMPLDIVDYVVAHELAHLKEMNHSPRFWSVVEGLCPDWRARRLTLRRLGREIPQIQ